MNRGHIIKVKKRLAAFRFVDASEVLSTGLEARSKLRVDSVKSFEIGRPHLMELARQTLSDY